MTRLTNGCFGSSRAARAWSDPSPVCRRSPCRRRVCRRLATCRGSMSRSYRRCAQTPAPDRSTRLCSTSWLPTNPVCSQTWIPSSCTTTACLCGARDRCSARSKTFFRRTRSRTSLPSFVARAGHWPHSVIWMCCCSSLRRTSGEPSSRRSGSAPRVPRPEAAPRTPPAGAASRKRPLPSPAGGLAGLPASRATRSPRAAGCSASVGRGDLTTYLASVSAPGRSRYGDP